jgi:hypothetical protein
MEAERRILAKRERTARIGHRCDVCDGIIFPGDRYKITIELFYQKPWKWLRVTKEHLNPWCLHPDPDEEEIARDTYEQDTSNVIFLKAA